MLQSFGPIAIQLLFVFGFTVFILIFTDSVGPKKFNPVKNDIYECGVDYFSDARGVFNVKFYLIAMLFILFDIETVFIVPWSVVFHTFKNAGLGLFIFMEMAVFIAILLVGYIYILKKGALQWE